MMSGLEKYIIRENKEFDAFCEQVGGYTAFCELREKVHLALEKLSPGKFYDITKIEPEEKKENFIKMLCFFFQFYKSANNFTFEDNYQKIRRK